MGNDLDTNTQNKSTKSSEKENNEKAVVKQVPVEKNEVTAYDLVINLTYTQYPIMEEVAEAAGFRPEWDEEEDWDIWFIDGPTQPSLLQKLKPH